MGTETEAAAPERVVAVDLGHPPMVSKPKPNHSAAKGGRKMRPLLVLIDTKFQKI